MNEKEGKWKGRSVFHNARYEENSLFSDSSMNEDVLVLGSKHHLHSSDTSNSCKKARTDISENTSCFPMLVTN
jgi:hypothetical protein